MKNKLLICSLFFTLFLVPINAVFAENADIPDPVTIDEPILINEPVGNIDISDNIPDTIEVTEDLDEITAEDLGVSEPNILPNSRWYIFKVWYQKARTTLTFDPTKKVELKIKYANQKLLEAQKLAKIDNQDELVVQTLEKFQEEIEVASETINNDLERFKKKRPELSNQMIDHALKQQNLMDKLKLRVKNEYQEKIQNTKEKHLSNFSDKIIKNVPIRELEVRVNQILEDQDQGFRNFKNLEVLKRLEDNVPEQAKIAILNAQSQAIKQFDKRITQMDKKNQEKFSEYLEKAGGDEEKQKEIINSLVVQSKVNLNPITLFRLQTAKLQITNRIKVRTETQTHGTQAPIQQQRQVQNETQTQAQIANPAAIYCLKMGGKLEMRKNEDGITGYCSLPNGTVCEEWKLFRGECSGQPGAQTNQPVIPQQVEQELAPGDDDNIEDGDIGNQNIQSGSGRVQKGLNR